MNPILSLAIDMAVQLVLRPEIERRYGGTVPGRVLAAATSRLTTLIEEGKARDLTTVKTLALFAIDEAVKSLDEEDA